MTDKLGSKEIATLVHLGSLPAIWLPPGEIRDERTSKLDERTSLCWTITTAECGKKLYDTNGEKR